MYKRQLFNQVNVTKALEGSGNSFDPQTGTITFSQDTNENWYFRAISGVPVTEEMDTLAKALATGDVIFESVEYSYDESGRLSEADSLTVNQIKVQKTMPAAIVEKLSQEADGNLWIYKEGKEEFPVYSENAAVSYTHLERDPYRRVR